MIVRHSAAAMTLAACAQFASPALAEAPVAFDAAYTADVAAVLSGGADRRVRYLDNLDLLADADLAALVGWRGGRAHAHVINNLGARPNDSAGTLDGIDNIEVPRAAVRLLEAWVEQDLGRGASLRAGLIDLNAEFNASAVSDQLIAPPFGITSELALTGSAGPSIFPSTALAARVYLPVGGDRGYWRAGLFNARASTLGDPDGIDLDWREGVLAISEAGAIVGKAQLTLGGWAYSRRYEPFYTPEDTGGDAGAPADPARRRVWGAYAGIEGELLRSGERSLGAMVRGGFSQGGSTPFDRSAQAALKLTPLLRGRPGSQLSVGMHTARTSPEFRAQARAEGDVPASAETALELTVGDQVLPFLTVQPDVQVVFHPGGRAAAPTALVTTLRLTFTMPRP